MFGIYNLLCDHCNLLFTGFAVPGTVGKKGKPHHERSSRVNKQNMNASLK
jgi:hypothetical protein